MLSNFLNLTRRCKIISKMWDFMGQHLCFGSICAGTFFCVLCFAYRLSLCTRIIKRFGLWRKLVLAMPAAAITWYQRALANFLLCFSSQRFFHFYAVIMPLRPLKLAWLANVYDQRPVKYQRLVFFCFHVVVLASLEMPLLYVYVCSIYLLVGVLQAQFMLFSRTFFSSPTLLLLLILVISRIFTSIAHAAIRTVSYNITTDWHARLIQLLRYATRWAWTYWMRW